MFAVQPARGKCSARLRTRALRSRSLARPCPSSGARRGRSAVVARSAASFAGTLSSPASAQIAWNTLSFVLAGAAAFYFSRQPQEPPTASECPRCNGTGVEPCFCNKWSDGDTGCPACNYTGMQKCKACGGGGTAVPIAIAIRKDDGVPRPPYGRQ